MHQQRQDDLLPVLIEEIHDTHVEIHENVDTNIGSHAPALKSNMSTSGTGTPRTERESGLHKLQVIHTELGDIMEVLKFSDLLTTISAGTVVESEDELEEYVQDLSKDQIFNEIIDARMQNSLSEVMVTRDS